MLYIFIKNLISTSSSYERCVDKMIENVKSNPNGLYCDNVFCNSCIFNTKNNKNNISCNVSRLSSIYIFGRHSELLNELLFLKSMIKKDFNPKDIVRLDI